MVLYLRGIDFLKIREIGAELQDACRTTPNAFLALEEWSNFDDGIAEMEVTFFRWLKEPKIDLPK